MLCVCVCVCEGVSARVNVCVCVCERELRLSCYFVCGAAIDFHVMFPRRVVSSLLSIQLFTIVIPIIQNISITTL